VLVVGRILPKSACNGVQYVNDRCDALIHHRATRAAQWLRRPPEGEIKIPMGKSAIARVTREGRLFKQSSTNA